MSKHILFNQQARESVLQGMDILANAVKVTLGPKGRNVMIQKAYGTPLITNDGVTIAREVELEDSFQDMGAKLLFEVANKTNELAGDGTTTATVLAQSMIHKGMDALKNGSNPVLLRKGFDLAAQMIETSLKTQSKIIEDSKGIIHVATLSSGSKELGELIAQAIEMVGKEGVVSIEESSDFETKLEISPGLSYDKGYVSKLMTNSGDTMEVQLENSLILICDYKIQSMTELVPILEQVIQQSRPLLLVAEDFEEEVISNLVINKLRGSLNVIATKAPSFGEYQKEILTDIAILSGGIVFSHTHKLLEQATLDDLGSFEKIKVSKDQTTLIKGKGDSLLKLNRINLLKEQLENLNTDFDKQRIQQRISKLSLGIATIKVGALTEAELQEKKLRIEDALFASKAALSEGVVSGGGHAYLVARDQILSHSFSLEKDIAIGLQIVLDSLSSPLVAIADNAGYDGHTILNQQLSNLEVGFDALNGEWVNLLEKGIMDPTKVSRLALLHACSIAGLFLTTEVAMSEIIKDDSKNLPAY